MRFFILLIVSVTLGSCANLSRFQTGQTIGKGNVSIGANVSGYGVTNEELFNVPFFPFLAVHGSYGVYDNLDLGLSVSSGGNAQVFGKFQFVGDQASFFSMAVEPGMSLQYSGNSVFDVTRAHLGLPFSLHFTPKSSIFFEPKLIGQIVESDANTYFSGISGGYEKKFQTISLTIGGSYFGISDQDIQITDQSLFQIGLGITKVF